MTISEVNVHLESYLTWDEVEVPGTRNERDVAFGPAPFAYNLSSDQDFSVGGEPLYSNKIGTLTVVGTASYPDNGGTTTYSFKAKAIPGGDHLDLFSSEWTHSP
jgi:hypothetical protein